MTRSVVEASTWKNVLLRRGLAFGASIALLGGLAACSSNPSASTSSGSAGASASPASSGAAAGSSFLIADIGSTNPAAAGFEEWRKGMDTYFKVVNNVGGVDGHPIKFDFADDLNFDTQTELSAYNQFKQQGALAIVGLTLDSSIPVITARAEQDGIPTMLGSGSERQVVVPVQKYLYGATPDFRQYTQGMLGAAKQAGLTKIALVYIDSSASRDAATYAKTVAPQLGVNIVTTQFTPLTATDYRSQLQAAQSAGARAVVTIQSPSGTSLVAKAMQSLGYKATVFGVSTDTGVAKSMQQLNTPYTSVSYIDVNPSAGYTTMAAAAQKYGTADVLSLAPAQFGNGWVAGMVFVAALKGCAPDCTPSSLNDQLQKVTNLDTGGLTGPLTLSPTKHNLMEALWTTKYTNSKLVSGAKINTPTN
jgi:branched-chain amino acid transport system substrate-binding protein